MTGEGLVVISVRVHAETGSAVRDAISALAPVSDAMHIASRPLAEITAAERQALVDVLAEGNHRAYVFVGLDE